MDVWGSDKLALFVIFFLPGFVSMKVYDLLVPGDRRDFSKSIAEAIAYSTLNFAALSWLILPLSRGLFYREHMVWFALGVAVVMVTVPAAWPFLFLRVAAWGPIAKRIIHPLLKPWDFVFGRREPYWIIVHLKDGRRIGGRYDADSFASSSPAEEQIYLQQVWALDEYGGFQHAVERSRGVIVMKSEIVAVEFFGN